MTKNISREVNLSNNQSKHLKKWSLICKQQFELSIRVCFLTSQPLNVVKIDYISSEGAKKSAKKYQRCGDKIINKSRLMRFCITNNSTNIGVICNAV